MNSALTSALPKDAWANTDEFIALRKHLETNNGVKGLDILEPGDTEHAVRLFHRDGFVVIANVLNDEQTEVLANGCSAVISEILQLDQAHKGNRGSHRYSFGGSSLTRSQLHRPEWQMLLDIPVVLDVVTAIFGSPDFVLRAASGDFCLPGAVTTEIAPAGPFYFAEDYHQQYLAKNPGGYCGLGGTGVSCPIGVGVGAA